MTRQERNSLVAIPVVVAVAAAVAAAASAGGARVGGVPVYALAVALAFLIQWIAFIPAWLSRSEGFYDLTGGLTYVTVTAVAVLLSGDADARSILLLVLVAIWAARLASFLFRRIRTAGKDERFDAIKTSFFRFLLTWTLQGLWVSMTLAAALAAITATVREPLGVFEVLGLLVWVAGFAIEAAADWQKSRFKADAANRGRFIREGLWAWSRHPNYFGEIVLWVGVAIIAVPVLSGWQWVTLVSPVFVVLLLTRVSGVPLLEKRADERWGGQPDYEAYKARTPVLVPRPPAGNARSAAGSGTES